MAAASAAKPPPDIAIVGIACVFPDAADTRAYWTNILGKVEAVGAPSAAWDAERYADRDGGESERISTAAGGFLRDLYRFDPVELGVMPASIDGGEPDQFLALKVARGALADAGYLDDRFDHTNTGIILGHSTYLHRGHGTLVQHGVVLDQTLALVRELVPTMGDAEAERLRAAMKAKLPPFNAANAPGMVPNVMTGRIANRLDLKGPNYLIDAACASSLLAVQAAIEELRAGRADLMLSGGVNASIPPQVYMIFTQLEALSGRSRVRPFDAGADGTLLGEGLGIVALKRLDDAVRDGDRVYAVLKGVGQSSDGKGAGILAPRLDGEVLSFERAYAGAGLDVAGIGLVEAHGTGIPLGDQTEIAALKTVMGGRAGMLPHCAIGSVKSMIGHCIPAAGVAGLIKAALALHHKVLPPTLCDAVNPALGIEETPLYVNTESRPWVQPPGTPRRAAVNAFGFGGVNAHAILEESPERCARPDRLSGWPSELVVVAGATRAELIDAIDRLARYLAAAGDSVSLADVARAAAARAAAAGAHRLAIVADDRGDLATKLDKARGRIADESCRRLQVRSGIYFTNEPLEGGLAFLFPGEGAQYQGMLADVLMHIPVAREWFDFWDDIFGDSRGYYPSQCVFPPPTTVSDEVRATLETSLFGLELGSEAVFVASQAGHALLRHLGLAPDAVVGHSSGENGALLAARAIRLKGWGNLKRHIHKLNEMYRRIDEAGDVATGALLTVGAVPRERVAEVVATCEGAVHLALDNCPNEAVLFGSRETMEAVAGAFRKEGGLCTFLPFDRAYHTPLFQPVADAVAEVFADVAFAPPRTSLYSCATAARLPDDAEEIRRWSAAQWSSQVRFVETVEQMYADGIRFFVEVGPASNLTGFVNDILRKQHHLAVSIDNRGRSSLSQLLHSLGRLWVNGREMDVEALFADRRLAPLDLDASPPDVKERVIDNTLPFIRLDDGDVGALRDALGGAAATRPQPPEADGGDGSGLDDARSSDDARARAVADHFALMREFLDSQRRVFEADLGAAPAVAAAAATLPFLDRVVEEGPDHLVAECDLELGRERFLEHHVLYADRVSDLDPALTALPVVPLAVSLEIAAEAAAALSPPGRPVRLEAIRAYNWIALDDGAVTLRIEARRRDAGDGEDRIEVAVGDGAARLIEAVVVLAAAAPDARPALAPLAAPKPSRWRDDELYTSGMFHGPLFRSVRHVAAWDETGLDAELADTPLAGFFAEGHAPELLLNPVLLDAVGHVTAFWIAQELGTDFSCFPSQIARIDLGAADEERTAGAVLRGRLAFERSGDDETRFLVGDYECISPDGAVLFRVRGWRDRFFAVPHRFFHARTNPRDGWYGDDARALFPARPEGSLVWMVPPFPPRFLDDAGAIWTRLLAHTVLAAEERAAWAALPPNPKRRAEWIVGRLALKEAARRWCAERYGVLLFPADVVIRSDAAGRPYVAGDGLEEVGAMPEVSLAHAAGCAVAAAAPPGTPVGVDVERLGRVALAEFIAGGFDDDERAALAAAPEAEREARALELWCAKEAAAKSLGVGLNGRPQAFRVREAGAAVRVATPEGEVPALVARHGDFVLALASPRIVAVRARGRAAPVAERRG